MRKNFFSILFILIISISSLHSVEIWNGITSEMNTENVSEFLLTKFNAKFSNKETKKLIFPSHDEKGHPELLEYYYYLSEQEPFFIPNPNYWLNDNDFTQNNINFLFWNNKIYCFFISLNLSFNDVKAQLKKSYGKETKFSGGYLAWENKDILVYGYPSGDSDEGYFSRLVYFNKQVRNEWIKECEKKEEERLIQEEKERNKLKNALLFLKFDDNPKTFWKQFSVGMSPEDCTSILKDNFKIEEEIIIQNEVELHYNPETDGLKNPPLKMYGFRVLDYAFFDNEHGYTIYVSDDSEKGYRELRENLCLYFYNEKLYAIEIKIQNEIPRNYITSYCTIPNKFVRSISPKNGSGLCPNYYKLKNKDIYYDSEEGVIIYIDSIARQDFVKEQSNKRKENDNKIKF